MSIGLLTLAAHGRSPLVAPQSSAHTRLSPSSALGTVLGGGRDSAGEEQMEGIPESFLEQEEKGNPGRFVQQGSVPGHAAHRVRHVGHPCLAVGAHGVTWCL